MSQDSAIHRAENLRHAAAFFALAALLALAVALATDRFGEATPLVTMFTPLAAVLILRLAILRDGWSPRAWSEVGLQRFGWRYWPLAALLPLAVLLPGFVILWAIAGDVPTLTGGMPPIQFAVKLAVTLLLGMVLGALGEEIGWRGYLQPRLAALGPWRSLFATGFLHGLWHMPLLLLTPFYHGGTTPLLVVPLFLLTFTLAGSVYGFLRIASGSIWPVALMHRSVNTWWDRLDAATIAGTPLQRELLAGESGLGVIGMLGVVTLILMWVWRGRRV